MKIIDRYGTVLRLYDNGGKSIDRYTIIPPRWATEYKEGLVWLALSCNEKPFQGFSSHISAVPGKHLGKRIHWDSLPNDVKTFVVSNFPEFRRVDYVH